MFDHTNRSLRGLLRERSGSEVREAEEAHPEGSKCLVSVTSRLLPSPEGVPGAGRTQRRPEAEVERLRSREHRE